VKKPVSKFAFPMQPAALQRGRDAADAAPAHAPAHLRARAARVGRRGEVAARRVPGCRQPAPGADVQGGGRDGLQGGKP
jgi:hypothetical protein